MFDASCGDFLVILKGSCMYVCVYIYIYHIYALTYTLAYTYTHKDAQRHIESPSNVDAVCTSYSDDTYKHTHIPTNTHIHTHRITF